MDYEMAKLQGLNVVIGEHDTYFETRRSRLQWRWWPHQVQGRSIKRRDQRNAQPVKDHQADIGELQATMLEQAAVTGKMESIDVLQNVVKEYYEMQTSGLFKVNIGPMNSVTAISAKSECPMSMRPDQDIQNSG